MGKRRQIWNKKEELKPLKIHILKEKTKGIYYKDEFCTVMTEKKYQKELEQEQQQKQ